MIIIPWEEKSSTLAVCIVGEYELRRRGSCEPYRYEFWRNGVLQDNTLHYFDSLRTYVFMREQTRKRDLFFRPPWRNNQ